MCEIVFAKVIDHRSRVKMIHHRPTVYTYRLATLSLTKTHEIAIDRPATRLDSLPSPTQFLPRSGPRSIWKVASWCPEKKVRAVSIKYGTGLHLVKAEFDCKYWWYGSFIVAATDVTGMLLHLCLSIMYIHSSKHTSVTVLFDAVASHNIAILMRKLTFLWKTCSDSRVRL